MKHRFWVLIYDGVYWHSYARCNTYKEAQDAVEQLTMDWNEVRITLVLE